jgi:AbrB family looped-hinge helix DNA binding protein
MGTTEETAVTERWGVTIPAAIREELDIEPGDKIRWSITESGDVDITVVRERRGALADAEPIDAGTETDAVELSEEFSYEGD